MEDGIKRGKILFFDPNNTTHEVNNNNNTLVSIFGGKELMKAPEDLSVSVDLEVINKSRRYIIDGGNNATISSVASGKKSNFLGGMELGNTNVLSTYFTDIKYDETDKETLSEALSIKSIDIEFNSWYVATVTINFVDVRGAALFSPSEHNQINSDEYIKDSPYSAFFTMPYPQFNLKVKGVYGDAVSYPLHLLDFKSSFNNSTGNFEINTSFIGYTYAILNDIQMTYLITAPYLDLYGKDYWKSQVENGRFNTLENAPLPKIPELIENVVRGEYNLQKAIHKDPTVTSNNQTRNKINDIGAILNQLDAYVDVVRKNVTLKVDGQYSFEFEKNNDVGEIEDSLNSVIALVTKFNSDYSSDALFTSIYYIEELETDEDKDGRVDLSKELLPNYNKLDVTKFNEILSSFKKRETKNLVKLDEETSNIVLNTLIETYGFKPSIYNFTKILLAHMETLLHVIGQTAKNSVGDTGRKLINNKHETDLKGDKIDPFPWLTIDDKDAWFGDFPEYADYSEVKLVESFHRAKVKATSLINTALTEEIGNDTVEINPSTKISTGEIWLPINAFDNSINEINGKEPPYSNFKSSPNGVSVIDVKSVLSSRIATIAAFAPVLKGENIKNIIRFYGIAESINILNQIGYSKNLVKIFIVALDEIITFLGDTIDKKSYGDKFVNSIEFGDNQDKSFFFTEGFSILYTGGQLPLNDKTKSELESSIEKGSVIDEENELIYNGFHDSVTYYEKNSPNNFKIIEGKSNCELVYNKWFTSVDSLINSSNERANLRDIMGGHYLSKEDLHKSYSSQISEDVLMPEAQPMLNRIGEVSDNSQNFFRELGDLEKSTVNNAINDKDLAQNFYRGNTNDTKEFFKTDLNINGNSKVNITDIERFTYPLVGGITKDWDYRYWLLTSYFKGGNDKTFTLFGHPLYYKQGDHTDDNIGNLAKAYLFLQTLPINTNEIMKDIHGGASFMRRLPKVVLLFLGSVQWRRRYMVTTPKITSSDGYAHEVDPIFSFLTLFFKDEYSNVKSKPSSKQTYRQNNIFTLNSRDVKKYDTCDISLDSSISKKLIKYFTDWCTKEENGWNEIRNILEHKDEDGKSFDNSIQFKQYIDKLDVKDGVKVNANLAYQLEVQKINIIKNVRIAPAGNTRGKISEDKFEYTFRVLNIIYKDVSEPVKTILNLLSEEVIIAHTGEFKLFNVNPDTGTTYFLTTVKELADRIRYQLKEHDEYKDILEKNKGLIGNSTYDKNREINLQTYKYLKSLYDKWVSGYVHNDDESEYKWINTKTSAVGDYKKTYDIKNFKFIDRSYNHIGQKFILNLKDVLSDIGLNEQKTLYTTITKVLSKNNFLFIAMPNYQPWNKASDFAKIFKPIPHHLSKMGVSNDMYNAQFLCMYTGELAKRLGNNGEYKNDWLDLNIANNLTIAEDFNDEKVSDSQPKPTEGQSELIKDQLESVPVFAVSYGKQNQQYFKNISLNQNNPATTEASVMAIERLVERNDKTTSIELVTQDLYNIYSDYSYLCEIEMLGCAQIQPMMYFQLTNIPMWNGAYLIYKVKHSIQPGTMTTNITGMKMGKRYPDFITPKTITYGDLGNIYGGNRDQYIEIDKDQKVGEYFKLSDYFKRDMKLPANLEFPITIVQRIIYTSSPVINKIYETWVNDKKQPKFIITSGYRSDSTTMHKQGLAVDIQIVDKGADEKMHKELFEHIKKLMRGGLKIDQLISESHISKVNDPNNKTRTYWIHVGVAKIIGTMISYRGECATMRDHNNKTYKVDETIKEAKGETTYTIPSLTNEKLLEKFIAFWKNAENNIKEGWDKNKGEDGEWYKYDDVGKPAIAYGLRIDDGFYDMDVADKEKLKDGTMGISEDEAQVEVRTRIKKAMKDNEEEMIRDYTLDKWNKVDYVYKYILADVKLNVGNIKSFPNLKGAVIDNNKDKIIKECSSGNVQRYNLRISFIKQNFG